MRNVTRYFKDVRSVYYYVNKSVRKPKLRHLLYKFISSFAPKSTLPAPDATELAQLRCDGFFVWDDLIDATTADAIRDYLLPKPVCDFVEIFKSDEQVPLKLDEVDTTEQRKLKYFDADIAACRPIVEIGNSEKILSMVAAYLGCKPTLVNMAAWWTKAGKVPSDTKFYDDMFHRDVDDYKFLKLFVYLTDVSPNNGAHSFIKSSHLSSKFTERRTFTDEEISENFPASDHMVMTGKRGCGFLEDTWGLHRSRPCVEGERLVLHFLYGITSMNAQTAPKPVMKNIYNVDAYTNRVYLY